jgi:hypothetical protein
MMILWALFGIAAIVVVSTWAWRLQMRAMHVVGLRLASMAGKPGTLVDVELTAVLPDHHSTLLIAFRPAGMRVRPDHDSSSLPPASTLVLSLPDDQQTLARLTRWQTSAAPILLWRDATGEQVEFSQMQTHQTVRLRVQDQAIADGPRKNSVNGPPTDVKNATNN